MWNCHIKFCSSESSQLVINGTFLQLFSIFLHQQFQTTTTKDNINFYASLYHFRNTENWGQPFHKTLNLLSKFLIKEADDAAAPTATATTATATATATAAAAAAATAMEAEAENEIQKINDTIRASIYCSGSKSGRCNTEEAQQLIWTLIIKSSIWNSRGSVHLLCGGCWLSMEVSLLLMNTTTAIPTTMPSSSPSQRQQRQQQRQQQRIILFFLVESFLICFPMVVAQTNSVYPYVTIVMLSQMIVASISLIVRTRKNRRRRRRTLSLATITTTTCSAAAATTTTTT